MMTEQEKMERGQLYDASAPELLQKLFATRDKLFELNYRLLPSQTEERERLLRDILGTTPERFTIVSPFLCDYGHNIHVGKNFFANYNCVMLDEAPITIGDNVLIAPNVGLYTAGHPIDVERRNQWLEYAWPITIGNNVGDIPANVIAGGNPCRVIRPVTEADRQRSYDWTEQKARKNK